MSYQRGDDEDVEEVEGEGEGEEEEELPQVAELANASVPNAMRGIRACKRCGLLKTLDQFINEGCENCPFLDMVRPVSVIFLFSLLIETKLFVCVFSWTKSWWPKLFSSPLLLPRYCAGRQSRKMQYVHHRLL